MTQANIKFAKKNNRNTLLLGGMSLFFAIAGVFFLPLSIISIIFGHLTLSNISSKHSNSAGAYAKAGLLISYGWLVITILSITIYALL